METGEGMAGRKHDSLKVSKMPKLSQYETIFSNKITKNEKDILHSFAYFREVCFSKIDIENGIFNDQFFISNFRQNTFPANGHFRLNQVQLSVFMNDINQCRVQYELHSLTFIISEHRDIDCKTD